MSILEQVYCDDNNRCAVTVYIVGSGMVDSE